MAKAPLNETLLAQPKLTKRHVRKFLARLFTSSGQYLASEPNAALNLETSENSKISAEP